MHKLQNPKALDPGTLKHKLPLAYHSQEGHLLLNRGEILGLTEEVVRRMPSLILKSFLCRLSGFVDCGTRVWWTVEFYKLP